MDNVTSVNIDTLVHTLIDCDIDTSEKIVSLKKQHAQDIAQECVNRNFTRVDFAKTHKVGILESYEKQMKGGSRKHRRKVAKQWHLRACTRLDNAEQSFAVRLANAYKVREKDLNGALEKGSHTITHTHTYTANT